MFQISGTATVNVEYEFKPPSRSMTISDSLGTIQNVVNQLPYLPSRVMAIITSSFLLTRESLGSLYYAKNMVICYQILPSVRKKGFDNPFFRSFRLPFSREN